MAHWLAVHDSISGTVYRIIYSSFDETYILLIASYAQLWPDFLLALPIETSTRYSPRGSTAGIIQPTQRLTHKVYTCIGIGKSHFILIIYYSLSNCKTTLEWFSFTSSPVILYK